MLTATTDSGGIRIEAENAQKGAAFSCPLCLRDVVLKKGRVRIPHFAHKPPSDCLAAATESSEHYQAKLTILHGMRQRGIRAEMEAIILSNAGDRRADVVAWHPTRGTRIAFEIQHTSLTVEEIERRTSAYAAIGVPVLWLPILKISPLRHFKRISGTLFLHLERYAAPEWQRWIFEYGRHKIWFFDSDLKKFWRGWFTPAYSYRQSSEWYDSSGEEQFSSGGWTSLSSKRGLTLEGPFDISDLQFILKKRLEETSGQYQFPNSRLVITLAGTAPDKLMDRQLPIRLSSMLEENWHHYQLQFWSIDSKQWIAAEFEEV